MLVDHAQFVFIASKHTKIFDIDKRTRCSRNGHNNVNFDIEYATVCRVAVTRNSCCRDSKMIRFVKQAIARTHASLQTAGDPKQHDVDFRTRRSRNGHTYFKIEVKLTLVCGVAVARNSRCCDFEFVALVCHAQFVGIASKHAKICDFDNRAGCARNGYVHFKVDNKFTFVCSVTAVKHCVFGYRDQARWQDTVSKASD